MGLLFTNSDLWAGQAIPFISKPPLNKPLVTAAGETEAGWRGCWCEILKGPPTHYRTVAAILSEGPWGSCYFLGESVTLSMC